MDSGRTEEARSADEAQHNAQQPLPADARPAPVAGSSMTYGQRAQGGRQRDDEPTFAAMRRNCPTTISSIMQPWKTKISRKSYDIVFHEVGIVRRSGPNITTSEVTSAGAQSSRTQGFRGPWIKPGSIG